MINNSTTKNKTKLDPRSTKKAVSIKKIHYCNFVFKQKTKQQVEQHNANETAVHSERAQEIKPTKNIQ